MLKFSKRRQLLAALALTPLMATGVFAQSKGLMTIIVNDPANPYWLTEGNVAKATAEKLGYTAVVVAHGRSPVPMTAPQICGHGCSPGHGAGSTVPSAMAMTVGYDCFWA